MSTDIIDAVQQSTTTTDITSYPEDHRSEQQKLDDFIDMWYAAAYAHGWVNPPFA